MTDTTAASPNLFVSRPESAKSQGRWLTVLANLQNMILLVWVANLCLLPQNLNSLVALFWLAALWVLMLVVGVWHIVKVPVRRRLAAWLIAAFPAAFTLVTFLNTTVGLPLATSHAAQWLFPAALAVFPLYWLARWLLRTTSPEQKSPVRMRLTTIILLAIAIMLMLQSIFLVWVPFTGDDFQAFKALFGSDWYVNLLQITLGTAGLIAIGAVPYVILGFVRGTGHRGAMIGIFLCLGISITCTLGLLAFFAMLSYG
ncbi:MAG: hypothetical protein ACR2Q3_09170 [Woeseiaceae bacterium]